MWGPYLNPLVGMYNRAPLCMTPAKPAYATGKIWTWSPLYFASAIIRNCLEQIALSLFKTFMDAMFENYTQVYFLFCIRYCTSFLLKCVLEFKIKPPSQIIDRVKVLGIWNRTFSFCPCLFQTFLVISNTLTLDLLKVKFVSMAWEL